MSRLASSPSLVSRISPVESASRRPTGYRRRLRVDSSVTARRRARARAPSRPPPRGLLSDPDLARLRRDRLAVDLHPARRRRRRAPDRCTTSPPTRTRPARDQLLGARAARRRRGGRGTSRAACSEASCSASWPSLLGALLAGLEQALAQLALVLGRRVEARRVGQRVEPCEAEEALEQRRRAMDRRRRSASGRTPRSARARSASATADSEETPRMRAISGRETGCR